MTTDVEGTFPDPDDFPNYDAHESTIVEASQMAGTFKADEATDEEVGCE